MKFTYKVVFYTTTFTIEETNPALEKRYPECTPRQAIARGCMEFAATCPSHVEIRDEQGVLVETVYNFEKKEDSENNQISSSSERVAPIHMARGLGPV